jgi:hypothetical protein
MDDFKLIPGNMTSCNGYLEAGGGCIWKGT